MAQAGGPGALAYEASSGASAGGQGPSIAATLHARFPPKRSPGIGPSVQEARRHLGPIRTERELASERYN